MEILQVWGLGFGTGEMTAVTVRAFVNPAWPVGFSTAGVDEPQGMLGVSFACEPAFTGAHTAFFF